MRCAWGAQLQPSLQGDLKSRVRGLLGALGALREGQIGDPGGGQDSFLSAGEAGWTQAVSAALLGCGSGGAPGRGGGCHPAGKVCAVRWGFAGSWWLSPDLGLS